ncbi:MAG: type 2 isopentenyl-diphosphate Delta-isomerase [Chloroflexi bacterium]|nr:type 2 isopentenyl-diphosphate Delta-isomerase [Chloroflexota bacterium]
MKNKIDRRKEDHLRINLEEDVNSAISNGLERYYFEHQALPELDLKQIDTSLKLFGKSQKAPIFISSMIGGTKETLVINEKLASVAQSFGIGMGVGSQRIGLEEERKMAFFDIRKYAPDIILMANIGAVQLNYSISPDDCKAIVESIGADALILHLNPLQEALQSEGDTNFSGLQKKIAEVCHRVPVPVVIKEVGWGISLATAKKLVESGVAVIDVAGAGGTSWSEVEKNRMEDEVYRNIASSFRDWGISTAQSIIDVREACPELPIFASGGLRSGVDVAKCIALGACNCGFAGMFLRAASISEARLIDKINEIIIGLRISMFVAGAPNISSLQKTPLGKR